MHVEEELRKESSLRQLDRFARNKIVLRKSKYVCLNHFYYENNLLNKRNLYFVQY